MKEAILFFILSGLGVAIICYGFRRIQKAENRYLVAFSPFIGLFPLMAAASILWNGYLQESAEKTRSEIVEYVDDGYVVYMDGQKVEPDALVSINYTKVTIEMDKESKQVCIMSK